MPRRWCWAIFLIATFTAIPDACLAQGFVERLEPPVVERGKTTRVTAIGSGLGKTIGLWTSLPAGVMRATPAGASTATRADFDVVVAADAPVGIAGFRVATIDGLTNAVLFLVEDLPVRPALVGDKAKVALPAAIWGTVREAHVDRFAIDVTTGQRVSFEVVGNRLGKDFDPLVILRDAKGRLVAERDNDAGLYFDIRFEHAFADAGTYTVEVRDARYRGVVHANYVLRMGRFAAGRVAMPSAISSGGVSKVRLPEVGGDETTVTVPASPARGAVFGTVKRSGDEGSVWLPLETTAGDVVSHRDGTFSIDDAIAAKIPGSACGVLSKASETHWYRLELAKGQKIQVRAEARSLNSPADLELAIVDSKGKEQRRVVENNLEEVILDFNAGNPGVYGLRVRELNRDGGPAFAYRLDIRSGQPLIAVSAEAEGLTIPRGTYQPVPLTITRTDYAGAIGLSLVGGPVGVTIEPSEIPEGTNAIVARIIAASDAPLGPNTIQILARPSAIKEAPAVLVRTRPLIDRQIVNVDLIPHALREDQRRLPPSVADRFAVQVTPPSPFAVELPESLVTLGRYQKVEFPIVTTRSAGFTSPLTFTAKGGQIAPKEEGRTRVYAELPAAKSDQATVHGAIHSLILTNLAKHRVDVTVVGIDGGRRIALTRSFDLDVRGAFALTAEPAKLSLEPGATAKVRIAADRLKTFDGDIAVQLSPSQGLSLPERIVIPRGQTGVDIEVKVDADRSPGRQTINLNATAQVNGFEEEQRNGRLEVDVVKTPAKKK